MLTYGVAWAQTNAAPPPALLSKNAAIRESLAAYRKDFPESIQDPLLQMLALPSSDVAREFTADQKAIVEKHRMRLIAQIERWFVFPDAGIERLRYGLVPLAEKVARCDSFGARITAGEGQLDGYLLANYTHICLSFIVPASFSDQSGTISELSASEVAQMDALDKKRYEIGQLTAESVNDPSCPYVEESFMGLAIGGSVQRIAYESPAAQRALQVTKRLMRDPLVARFHWNIYDLVEGVYGDSIASLRPSPEPVYIQDVRVGFIVRFFISKQGDFIAFCFSRSPDIFRKDAIPKRLPSALPNWFELQE